MSLDANNLQEARDLLGKPLPSELVGWFALVGGWPALLPDYEIVQLATSLDIWDEMQELMADQYGAAYFDREARSVALGESEPAGREARMFLPSFIPIASQGDNYLFVDTREGEMSGCVTAWDYSTTDQAGPLWSSPTAMLEELANALDSGTTFLGATPSVVDGVLTWD